MPDVNVLVYAHRKGTAAHDRYATWLTELANGPQPFGISELVLHGFVRVVTNTRIFTPPCTTLQAFQFVDALIAHPTACIIRPGPEHWSIFAGFAKAAT